VSVSVVKCSEMLQYGDGLRNKVCNIIRRHIDNMKLLLVYIRRAQAKVGLINLCKGLFSLNARIYYKLKSGT